MSRHFQYTTLAGHAALLWPISRYIRRQALPALGLAVLLAACGGAAPASTPASPGVASAAAKPASASVAASPAGLAAASAASQPSVPASAALTGPAAVAVRFPDLISRGDTSGVPALFTDDAVFIGSPPCNVLTFCKGPADIVQRVQGAAAVHGKQTVIGTPQVAGNIVFFRFEAHSDMDQRAGVERHLTLATVVVLGDKIGAWASQDDLSDAQTLKLNLYQQQQAQASASAAASAAAKTDPVGVAQRFSDAINSGDANAAAAVFADKAVNIAGNCPLRAPCTAPADILKQVQAAIGQHNKLTRIGDTVVVGNLAQQRTEVRNDITPKAGVERWVSVDTWTVQGGKAVGRLVMADLSDAQTLKYQLFQQAQASASGPAAAKPAASAAASAKPAG